MEEKEASAASNSTSPRGRKAFMLGVVNASEIKCTGDRKRRWDQQPGKSEGEEPPVKMPCDESLLENNVRHGEDVLEGIPLPSADRLAPTSPTLLVKEQIVVQTPSQVLNNIDINSSFPTSVASSLNQLNFSAGDQVTIEIETVAVNPSCEDESKTSVEVVDPNSTTVDAAADKPMERLWESVNCKSQENVTNTLSPVDAESCDTIDRASIDVQSAGNVDPDIMEVILGISPSKTAESPHQRESLRVEPVSNPDCGADVNTLNSRQDEHSGRATELDDPVQESIESKVDEGYKSEPHLTTVGSRLKGLVDYEDFSDESSQQSDKIVLVEPVAKTASEEVSVPCENSVDSKEEEFHDCVEQPIADESTLDSTSLHYTPSVHKTDDLINNNPSDNEDTYSESTDKNNGLSAQASESSLNSVVNIPPEDPDKSPDNMKSSPSRVIPEICTTIVEEAAPAESCSAECIPVENSSEKQLIYINTNSDTCETEALEPSSSGTDVKEIMLGIDSGVSLTKGSVTVALLETAEETRAPPQLTSQTISSESRSDRAHSNSQLAVDDIAEPLLPSCQDSSSRPQLVDQLTASETSEDQIVPSPVKAIDDSIVSNAEEKESCRSPCPPLTLLHEVKTVESLDLAIHTETDQTGVEPDVETDVNDICETEKLKPTGTLEEVSIVNEVDPENPDEPSLENTLTNAQVDDGALQKLQSPDTANEVPEFDVKGDLTLEQPIKSTTQDDSVSPQEDDLNSPSISPDKSGSSEIESEPLTTFDDNSLTSSKNLPEESEDISKNDSAVVELSSSEIVPSNEEGMKVDEAEDSIVEAAISGDKAEAPSEEIISYVKADANVNTPAEETSPPMSVDSLPLQESLDSSNVNAVDEKETITEPSKNNVQSKTKIETVSLKECEEDKLTADETEDTKSQGESAASVGEGKSSLTTYQGITPPESLTDKGNGMGVDESNQDSTAAKMVGISVAPVDHMVNEVNSLEVQDNKMEVEVAPLQELCTDGNFASVASSDQTVGSEHIPVEENEMVQVNTREVLPKVNDLKATEVEKTAKDKARPKDVAVNPVVMVSENNSVLSSVDLNMECESVDTVQSMESESSLPIGKEDADLINSNSVIDISSDSACSSKKDKDKSSLTFDLSKINNSNQDVSIGKFDNRSSAVLSSDDDHTSMGSEPKVKPKVDKSTVSKNSKSDVILVADSDSSNSNIASSGSNVEKSRKNDNLSFSKIKMDKGSFPLASSEDSVETIPKVTKSPVRNQVHKLETNLNDVKVVKSKSLSDKLLTVNKKSDPAGLSNSVSGGMESSEVADKGAPVSGGEAAEERSPNSKNEPITLRIFKDNNALHSESRESPKRPRLDDSPKQLEFTLKISKDAGTNIPKATMSPKRTVSPQRFPEPALSRISSEVSITPVLSPSPQEVKTPAKPSIRHSKVNDASVEEPSAEITLAKVDSINRVPSVVSHVNNIPQTNKTDLTNCNNINVSANKSIIEIKNEVPMGSPVHISVRGRRGKRGELHQNPGPPRKRGRPPKRPVEHIPMMTGAIAHYEMGFSGPGDLPPASLSGASPSGRGRPVRECRDRTRPIVFKTRKPRGGGNPRGRGGRGGARIPLIPGREALSIREQEELDRIEARNQQIRLEKLAKREAKLAKKAKRSFVEEPPPRELTEEEKAELAAKREAAERAAAEARALAAEARAIAAKEAERKAQEAAAAKELEKLAKIAARKERLRELHRMKREKILAKKAAKKLKDEERRKRKAAEKAAEQAAALQSMYEDETRMSAPDGSLRPLYGDDTPNRNKTGRMEINLSESKEVSVEQLAEYQWENGELYMIQEQVAEYLGVKSFKRKYPDLRRRPVDAEERKYLEDTCLVPKSLCDLGITAVSSAEVLDIMFQDFPDKYEEVRRYLREKQMKEISSKQRALSLYSRQQSDKAKADLREQAMECAATWNAHLNRERREERKCSMDLQSFIIHYPLSKRETMKQPTSPPGNYPVAVLPGQFCDYYKRYTSNELMYFPLNTVLYGPLKPNERRLFHSDASQSESEESSSSESSSSSEDSGSESEGDEDTKCKICSWGGTSRQGQGGGEPLLPPATSDKPEIFLPCTKCKLYYHPSCCNITPVMLPHVRKYNWVCLTCKVCVKCNSGDTQSKMRLCDLCHRGFHVSCLDPRKMVPEGNRWHCAVCSFCWACLAREPGGPSNQWLHEFIKDESGEKVYQRSLCAACCAKVGREAAAAVAAAAAATASSHLPGPSGVKLSSSTVTTSGTMTPPVVTLPSSPPPTPPPPTHPSQGLPDPSH